MNGLHSAASELILAAHEGDPMAFGSRYAELLDDQDFDRITHDVLAVLGRLVTGWLPDQAGPAEAIEAVHRAVGAAYPGCLRLLAINLVVLEQLARSVIGLSGLLRTLDGTEACLYAALLAGCSLSDEAELAALSAHLLDGAHG
ncbi:MAG: hypothetical protein ABI140_04005 [Jatrophihabitantaceae bacterium]